MPSISNLRIVPMRVQTAKMPHVSQVSKVYAKLRELIVDGRLAPGTRIVEAEIASRLAVSRTPVRDALRILQQEGFLAASQPGVIKSRLVVAPLTRRDAEELYALGARTEGWAARMTAQLPSETRQPLGEKLRELNDKLREAAESSHLAPGRELALCMQFRRTVVEAGAGPRLVTIHNTITLQVERYRRVYADLHMQTGLYVDGNNIVIRGIEEGDVDRAEQGIVANWKIGWQQLSEAIDALGERGSW